MYFFGVKVQNDFDAVKKIQTLLLLEYLGDKPQSIELNDRHVHFAGAQKLNVFNRALAGHDLNIYALLPRHVLAILRDLKITPVARPCGDGERKACMGVQANNHCQEYCLHVSPLCSRTFTSS